MRALKFTLQALGLGIVGVALVHVVLGPNAEVLLGSGISPSSIADPAIDSQNRFYGAAFALFGGVFLLGSADIAKYRPMLLLAFGAFFVAGLTRIISVVVAGWPPLPVLCLAVVEICGPPIMCFWLNRVAR